MGMQSTHIYENKREKNGCEHSYIGYGSKMREAEERKRWALVYSYTSLDDFYDRIFGWTKEA